MSTITPSITATTATGAPKTDQEQLREVAQQFEAIFLREMLNAARKTTFGGTEGAGNINHSQALDTFRQIQDDQVADTTAKTGILGFAAIIEQQMARFITQASSTSTTASNTSNSPTPTDSAKEA